MDEQYAGVNSCGLLNPASQFSTEIEFGYYCNSTASGSEGSNNSTLTPVRDKKVESLMGPSGISQYIFSYAH